jgi:hypothetical protein
MAADEAAVADYFRTVAAAIDIPIMIQDAPLSSTRLAAGQLAELARDAAAARPAAQTGARAGVGVLRWTVNSLHVYNRCMHTTTFGECRRPGYPVP